MCLKDASATAIYGSRGSNGVVMVTTKRGKSGQSRINFDYYTGIQEVSKKMDMLNAQQFAEFSKKPPIRPTWSGFRARRRVIRTVSGRPASVTDIHGVNFRASISIIRPV